MAERGAPVGNTNAKRGTMFRDAIAWAIEHYEEADPLTKTISGPVYALRKMCLAQVRKAAEHDDLAAFRELADRVDGKPAQAINVGGQDDNGDPVSSVSVRLVRGTDGRPT